MTLSPNLRQALHIELQSAKGIAPRGGNQLHADAAARAQLVYDLVREVYDRVKFGSPEGVAGEVTSIGWVADSANEHQARAMYLVKGDITSLEQKP